MVYQHNGTRFKPRKINLPGYVHPLDSQVVKKGNPDCDHDFPPEDIDTSRDNCVHWTCSQCGFEICYGVLD